MWIVGALKKSASMQRRSQSRSHLHDKAPRESNDLGFVTSDTCRACHPAAYHSWHDSYHRTMTQFASPQSVVGDFNDVDLGYFGSNFHLKREGDAFWAVHDGNARRVVQTTGSHHYQMYWLETEHGNRLENLPFAYLIEDQRWVRRNDIFMLPPDLAAQPEASRIWNDSCINCHTTQGQPRLDAAGLVANTQVGEIGIACESCHGPAADHVAYYSNPVNRYQGRLVEDTVRAIVNPARLDAKRSSGVCGQCHAISSAWDQTEWNKHGFRYRAGDDLQVQKAVLQHPARIRLPHNQGFGREFLEKYFWSDGMVRVSGREYNGLIESPCYQRGELGCLSCHSMHSSDPNDQLSVGMDTDRACLQCHSDVGSNVESHTNHPAESTGSRCYNCHMPHTTFGLVKAIRSHEIDSPSVSSSITAGRPNACNLCHLDRTLKWTADHLTDWYGAQTLPPGGEGDDISAALQWMIAGDAGQRALLAWHFGWKPAQVASGTQWLAPFLAELLDDDYAVVRSIAGRSLRTLPEVQDIDFDYVAPSSDRQEIAAQVLRRWNSIPKQAMKTQAELLLDGQGRILFGKLFQLRANRDTRPVDLLE